MDAVVAESQDNCSSDNSLTAEVRARVPQWMKSAVNEIAATRVACVSADIVREALAEYLESRNLKAKQGQEVAA